MSILSRPLLCIHAREFAMLQAMRYVVIFIALVCDVSPQEEVLFILWKMFAKYLFEKLFSHIVILQKL